MRIRHALLPCLAALFVLSCAQPYSPTMVTSITVSAKGWYYASAVVNDSTVYTFETQLSASILPANASNLVVTWSIVNTTEGSTAYATIDANGVVTIKSGFGHETFSVTASANDGSGITGPLIITTPTLPT
jgi:hypothetical protein